MKKSNIKIKTVTNKKSNKTYTYLEEYKTIQQYGRSKKTVNKRIRIDADDINSRLRLERVIKRLTAKNPKVMAERVIASYYNDSLMGMLVNTGFTVEQIAEQLDTTVDQLLNPQNWSKGFTEFKDPITGEEYEFVFGYSEVDQIFINKLN